MDDNLVWLSLKKGNADAVDILMKKYYSDLYNYGIKLSANRSLTKDCIQDLFVKLWRDREKLSEVTFVKTYLLKSLKQNLIKVMTKENRWVAYAGQVEYGEGIVFSQEDLLIVQQEVSDQQQRIVDALNKLPNRYREAVYLKFYSGLTNEQIAEMMSIKTQSVYNLIYEALKILKEHLVCTLIAATLWLP
jgi:RNA polymerase sigma factor (sigma-70 family)